MLKCTPLLLTCLALSTLPASSGAATDPCAERFLELEKRLNAARDAVAPGAQKVEVRDLPLRPIDKEALKNLREKKDLYYIVDSNDNLLLVDRPPNFGNDTMIFVGDSSRNPNVVMASSGGNTTLRQVREAGIIRLGNDKNLALTPTYEFTPENSVAARDALKKALGPESGFQVAERAIASELKSKVLHCTEIMAGQTALKRALLDQLLATNLVLTSAVLAGELGGANRLSTVNGRQVLTVDAFGTNLGAVAGSLMGKALVSTGANLPVSLVARTGTGAGMIEAQKHAYQIYLDENPQERAAKIANFDRAHFVARLPINHYLDRYIMRDLPEMLFNACKKDSTVRLIISPSTVRIAERYGSTILYYGARKAIVDE